ncbi:MAG: Uma2 family endonuclease [Planctomycetaceae bacterium]|nr:Uma2 family endonuclease [Planctomycetaceae bacterium]
MASAGVLIESDVYSIDEGDVPYEVVNGEYREVEPMSAYSTVLANVLMYHLSTAARQQRIGMAVMETLFTLRTEPLLRRQPDVALVHYARWGAGPPHVGMAWDTVPNLAVEIVSPSNVADDLDQKVVDYLSSGVEEAWILYPESRRMFRHRSLTEVVVITERDVIDGGELLPGFSLPLATLFAEAEPPAV